MLGVTLLYAGQLFAENIHRRIATGANPVLELRTQSGKVSVTGWDHNEIDIQGEVASDAMEVNIDGDSDKVTVQSQRRGGMRSEDARVDLSIQVPRHTAVRLKTDRGEVSVSGVQGPVKVDGISTAVAISDVQGEIDLKTVDGPIQMIASQGSVTAESISGDMKFMRVSGAKLTANTNSGEISYEGDFGQAAGHGGSYVLNSYSSPIEIIASRNASFNLTARSVQGTIQSSLTFRPTPEGNAFRRLPPGKFLQGRFNNGQANVEVNSFSGTIRLRSAGQ
jgi:DUF4097 and DUF4098 domain-containing protein YvlB